MAKFATFDEAGFPVAFYAEDVHGMRELAVYGDFPEPTDENPNSEPPIIGWAKNPHCQIPDDAVVITHGQWSEFLEYQGLRKWENGQVVEFIPEPVEPEPIVQILPAVTLWQRMSDDEAIQVKEAMETQPFRIRQIFLTANTYRSDHDLWPLLESMATELFGDERAAELLAT